MTTVRNVVVGSAVFIAQLAAFLFACWSAFEIRMNAIRIYGLVIHEFDPWFNFRAAQYMADNGWSAFFHWYDYMSWSPLGRPIGTTIYPGMQIASVYLWKAINFVGITAWRSGALDALWGKPRKAVFRDNFELMSLNDVCCYTPVWFGVFATCLLGTMTYIAMSAAATPVCCAPADRRSTIQTVSGTSTGALSYSRVNAALAAALCMAVIPAHIMRSVGGGYDNESVAISTMCLTFMCWCWAISTDSVVIPAATGSTKEGGEDQPEPSEGVLGYVFGGLLTGLAYVCMVATWGGYIFVCNLIGLHAFLLVFPLARFSKKLYWTFSTYYVVGTFGATFVPVVGLSPIKSLEQLAPALVFVAFQVLYLCEYNTSFMAAVLRLTGSLGKDKKITLPVTLNQRVVLYSTLGSAVAAVLAVVVAVLWPQGYFGPLSSRIRGLFVTHTRTGNPLVDSVAEHQPASPQAFYQFLHYTCTTAPVGLAIAVYSGVIKPMFFKRVSDATVAALAGPTPRRVSVTSTDPMTFMIAYALVTYKFSTKMNRLMLLMGPISAILTGIAFGCAADFVTHEVVEALSFVFMIVKEEAGEGTQGKEKEGEKEKVNSPKKGKKDKDKEPRQTTLHAVGAKCAEWYSLLNDNVVAKAARKLVAGYLVFYAYKHVPTFWKYSQEMSHNMSNPSIMFQARLQNGETIMVDDYREGYWWLRDHTPEDSRVMAWWDYGYQITGIGNRTTIADGNTCNHEHIALLGRCLTSPEKRAHKMIVHMADYVLIWAGGGGDDLAKSPHMARIGNSVYPDICPGDPTCAHFGFYNRQLDPTPSMAESLLYKLSMFHQKPGVTVDEKKFKLVFQSKYGKVRIYKVMGVNEESKAYTKDPSTRQCDAPGSWHCGGVYPPGLQKILDKTERKDFAQLEDFNTKKKQTVEEKAAADKYNREYMARMEGKSPGEAAAGGGEGTPKKSKKSKKSKKAKKENVD